MKIFDSLSRWLGYMAAAVIALLMLLIVADVCGRYFFNNPIRGASEFASFMLIIISFPALAWAALLGKHISVELVMVRFSQRIQAIVNSIMLLLALGIYVVITWQSALESMHVIKIAGTLRIPHAPFYWIMTLGWAIFCLSIVTLVIANITKAVKR